MKVAIIIPAVHWNCPYADIYTRLFESHGVDYDIISFNRKLDNNEDTKYHFDYGLVNSSGALKKFVAIVKYCNYVKRILKRENYDRVVVFSSQLGIGLLGTLRKKYRGRYIFDYRDVSVERHLMYPFKKLLEGSYMNVISSPGFLRVLPSGYNYEICHNLNISIAEKAIHEEINNSWPSGSKRILTIGGIRDYEANVSVINAVNGKKGYSLSFVGRGESGPRLADYCKKNEIPNVSFVGFYRKEEEPDYIKESDFINIFYPRIITHDTAVSNRFYNSLIYKKPMITTANTTQGDYAANYKVGIAVNNCDDLITKLDDFISKNDYYLYCERCNGLLAQFIDEQHDFEKQVLQFVDK